MFLATAAYGCGLAISILCCVHCVFVAVVFGPPLVEPGLSHCGAACPWIIDLFDYIVWCVRIRNLDFVNYVNGMVANITDKHTQGKGHLNKNSPLNMTLGIHAQF